MRRIVRAAVCALILASVSACASAGHNSVVRGPSNEITYAQIQTSKYTDAYSIVQAMHSNWMRTRGPQTLNGQDPVVLVYIDNQLFGGVDALRYVQLSNVQFIHYYDGNEATARWGLDHGAGVIYVSTDGRSAY